MLDFDFGQCKIKALLLKINIQFNFADSKIELNEKYVSKKNDTLTIESIKFYLSNVVLN